jgi:hypothetical protein
MLCAISCLVNIYNAGVVTHDERIGSSYLNYGLNQKHPEKPKGPFLIQA